MLRLLLLLPACFCADPSPTDLSKIDRTIRKEPAYKGKPEYALLVFGPDAKKRVWVVRDGDVTEMAVDRIVLDDDPTVIGSREQQITEATKAFDNELTTFAQSFPGGMPAPVKAVYDRVQAAATQQAKVISDKLLPLARQNQDNEGQPFDGEDRVLVPSPKVATYDLKPEMSCPEVTEKLTAAPKVAHVKSALAIRSAKNLPGVPIAVDGDKPAQPPLTVPAE